jgi:hypothetical protein
MKNQTITGIGCFAKPEKLRRIFLKLIQRYALGQIEGLDLINRQESGETESIRLIEALIAGQILDLDPSDTNTSDAPECKKITGFFLTLKDQKLNLSIFAKNGGCRQERHSAVLDALTNIRWKRLN